MNLFNLRFRNHCGSKTTQYDFQDYMHFPPRHNNAGHWLLFVLAFTGLLISCAPTKHVPQGQYLLRKNSVKLKSEKPGEKRGLLGLFKQDPLRDKKGELKDGLSSLVIQKPNT